jgi:uncharacterized integral membrane protein
MLTFLFWLVATPLLLILVGVAWLGLLCLVARMISRV